MARYDWGRSRGYDRGYGARPMRGYGTEYSGWGEAWGGSPSAGFRGRGVGQYRSWGTTWESGASGRQYDRDVYGGSYPTYGGYPGGRERGMYYGGGMEGGDYGDYGADQRSYGTSGRDYGMGERFGSAGRGMGGGYDLAGGYGSYGGGSYGGGSYGGGSYGGGSYGGGFRGGAGYDTGSYGTGYGIGGRGFGRGGGGTGMGGYAEGPRDTFIPEEAYRTHPELNRPQRHSGDRWPGGRDAGMDVEIGDDEIRQAVRQSLYSDNWVNADEIQVEVTEGVVTLTGEVSDYMEARYAWDDTWESDGVRGVINQLTVRTDQPTTEQHGDTLPQTSGGKKGKP